MACRCAIEDSEVSLSSRAKNFPDPDLKAALRQRGHQFANDESSTWFIVTKERAEFPEGIEWTIPWVVADRPEASRHCFNDRTDCSGCTITKRKTRSILPPKPKAILRFAGTARHHSRGIGEIVAYRLVLENARLFSGIHLLPPGSAWVSAAARSSPTFYFEPKEWEQQNRFRREQYYPQLRDDLREIFPVLQSERAHWSFADGRFGQRASHGLAFRRAEYAALLHFEHVSRPRRRQLARGVAKSVTNRIM